ncbi:MAG: IGHMBP2 family helicase, partial [Daejeonella sp.]
MSAPYFQHLLSLLKTERQADLLAYQQLSQSTTIADRRAAGLSWYPIAIRNTEISRGDYLTVEVERTTHQDIAHQ